MKKAGNRRGGRTGFTIIELLVVIAVMSVIATLAIGAALKSLKQSREKRVGTTIVALEMALSNYRARENHWPVTFDDADEDKNNIVWYHGIHNAKVFKDLCAGGDDKITKYLDPSSLVVEVNDKRMTLMDALTGKKPDIVLGYPYPANQNVFCCFCVEFNRLTDSVKIHRQDMRKAPYKAEDRVEGDHECVNSLWGKAN